MKHFEDSTEEIEPNDVLELFNDHIPNSFVDIGGDMLLISETDMEKFSDRTQVDKYIFDIGNPNCRFYAGIFWAFVLQESAKQKLKRPLAFFTAKSVHPTQNGHRLNGFITTEKQIRILEPQTDKIITLEEWKIAGNEIQVVNFP